MTEDTWERLLRRLKLLTEEEAGGKDLYNKTCLERAEHGVAEAQFQMGLNAVRGEGVPQSDEEAMKWFTKAIGQRKRFQEPAQPHIDAILTRRRARAVRDAEKAKAKAAAQAAGGGGGVGGRKRAPKKVKKRGVKKRDVGPFGWCAQR